MANELTKVNGTEKTLVSSGASVSNAAVSAAPAASYSIAADGGGFPFVRFVLTTSFGAAPTVGKTIALLIRPLNIDGTADAPAPSTTYLQKYVGSFVVSADTSQSLALQVERPLPDEFDAYVYNVDTGQGMSAGWTLKATPYTYKPAA